MVKYTITNLPEDLPPGIYTSKLIDAKFEKDDLNLTLEFIGNPHTTGDCLFPIIKHPEPDDS